MRTLLVLFAAAAPATAAPFRLTLDPAAHPGPVSGRAFVLLLPAKPSPLPRSLNWFSPEPAFAADVTGWTPGKPLDLGDALATVPLAKLKPGKYWAVAVLDRDLGGVSFAAAQGNLYSEPLEIDFDPAVPLAFTLDRVYKATPPADTDAVKFVEVESQLLTTFHGKPTALRAGVILPPGFSTSPDDKRFPVVYEIPGFGGDHRAALFKGSRAGVLADGVEAVWVVLDANCRLGHHVFADSANNGPCGQALMDELMPHIEGRFRCGGEAKRRLVTGHSSGGWSSLWLQIAYPEAFAGCWSTSPDPVDFRDFQRVNLYRGDNLFTADGQPRPLSRGRAGRVLQFRSFSDMERVMGHGGQLASFEAVFSPRGPDNAPRRLWDRGTGAIDPVTAKAWEKYDIRLTLERDWATLGPKLAGKLHVWMGDEDTFLLDGATRLLKKSLADLGSDAVVELFPGKDHGMMADGRLRERMKREMAAALAR